MSSRVNIKLIYAKRSAIGPDSTVLTRVPCVGERVRIPDEMNCGLDCEVKRVTHMCEGLDRLYHAELNVKILDGQS